MKLDNKAMDEKYETLKQHIEKQVNNILCFDMSIGDALLTATERCRYNFSFLANKYYQNNEIYPSPFHSGQYTILLYYLSRELFLQDGNGIRAEKIYYLNKILNGVDIFYEVNMPKIWGVEHPLGSIMGRAAYGDRFFFYQGCTVGGNGNDYPAIGNGVVMYSNAKVLGKSIIGDNVIFSANAYVIDQVIPSNSVVFGQGRNVTIKKIDQDRYHTMTKQLWKW